MKSLLWFAFLLFLDLAIPYGLLSNYQKITGAFTFWIIWGTIAILSIFILTQKWEDERK